MDVRGSNMEFWKKPLHPLCGDVLPEKAPFDLASVGQELGTLLGGGYVNHFNYFDRSYKVIPQIGEAERATVAPLLDLKIKTPSGEMVPVSTFTHIEASVAPRVLNRFQQRNSVRIYGGVRPGVTKEEGLRVLEHAAAAVAGPSTTLDYVGESRQIRREGNALATTLLFAVVLIYLVLAAQFQSFRDPLQGHRRRGRGHRRRRSEPAGGAFHPRRQREGLRCCDQVRRPTSQRMQRWDDRSDQPCPERSRRRERTRRTGAVRSTAVSLSRRRADGGRGFPGVR